MQTNKKKEAKNKGAKIW